MLYMDGALGLVLLALWIFCLVDVISTDESQCRNLPKTYWVLIVLFLFDVGSILWLVAGRTWPSSTPARTSAFPEYDRPGRFAATRSDEDDDFLRRCRERAEEQRAAYREKKRQDEADGEA